MSATLSGPDLIGDILHPGYPTDHSFQMQFLAPILYHPVKGNDEPTGTDVYPILYALSSETGTNELYEMSVVGGDRFTILQSYLSGRGPIWVQG